MKIPPLRRKKKSSSTTAKPFTDLLNRFGRFCTRAIHKGNVNSFEVFRNGQSKAALPVTVLVLLLIFAFWVTIPLIVIGLFFGFHYRFTGPDLGRDSVNSVMDGAAKAADDIKHSFTETEDTK